MLTLVLEEQLSDRTHLDKNKNAEEETFTIHKIEKTAVDETFTFHKLKKLRTRGTFHKIEK